jgi:hypothetical protein
MYRLLVIGLLALGTVAWVPVGRAQADDACVQEKLENQRLTKQLAEYQINNGVAVLRQSTAEITRLEAVVAEQQKATAVQNGTSTTAPPTPTDGSTEATRSQQ